MSDDTHYAVLGVSETATELDIRSAYRNLLKKIHPDTVATLSPDLKRLAEGATKDITEAYSVLSDTNKRHQYDQTLAERRRNAVGHPTASDVPRGQPARAQTAARARQRHQRRHRSSRRSRKLRSWASKRPVLAGVLTGLLLFLALVIVLWVAVRAFSA
jgi:DnaJ-class molecular chaperone